MNEQKQPFKKVSRKNKYSSKYVLQSIKLIVKSKPLKNTSDEVQFYWSCRPMARNLF